MSRAAFILHAACALVPWSEVRVAKGRESYVASVQPALSAGDLPPLVLVVPKPFHDHAAYLKLYFGLTAEPLGLLKHGNDEIIVEWRMLRKLVGGTASSAC